MPRARSEDGERPGQPPCHTGFPQASGCGLCIFLWITLRKIPVGFSPAHPVDCDSAGQGGCGPLRKRLGPQPGPHAAHKLADWFSTSYPHDLLAAPRACRQNVRVPRMMVSMTGASFVRSGGGGVR